MAKKKKRITSEKQSEVRKKEKTSRKKQIESQNKILKNFFIGIGVIIITSLLIYLFIYQTKNFEYEGVKFKKIREGDLILYKTSLPVRYQGEKVPYNFYLRNDPRKLKEISFDGELNLKENLVMNSTESFNCDGYGIIAIVNLMNLYRISGIEVIKDENATCDPEGRFSFIQLQAGNETNIEKFGPSCYNININNCEILKAIERLMMESFIEINKLI